MKTLIMAAAALTASPLLAQAAPDHSAHAGHEAAPASAARLSLDTPIETIVADPAGKAVIDAHLPGATTHQHYDMFKGMSLRALAGMAPDRLPADALAKVEADLAKIK